MTTETSLPRSRRAILTAGFAAGAAAVATALERPLPASAVTNPIELGQGPANFNGTGINETSATTRIYTSAGTGLYAQTAGTSGIDGFGIRGTASAGSGGTTGVYGECFSPSGIGTVGYASAGTGILARTDGAASIALWAFANSGAGGATRGILGQTFSATGTGIQGTNADIDPPVAANTGVHGYADKGTSAIGVKGESPAGTGVRADSSTGTALDVHGKSKFSRSGKASIAANAKYVDVTVPGGLSSGSVIYATMQTYRTGVAIAAARPNYPSAGKIRIYLTKVGSTTSVTYVGWFVAEH